MNIIIRRIPVARCGCAAKRRWCSEKQEDDKEKAIRIKREGEEMKARLRDLKDVQRRFDLEGPMELQMRKEGRLKSAEDLPPKYRFTPPATVRQKKFEEQITRLEQIPGVKILRGAGDKIRVIDVPMDAINKAELDYNTQVGKRVYTASMAFVFFCIAGSMAFIYMVWKVLSADPGPPPDEPIGARIFLEIYQEDERVGTVVLGLYTERCPMTCENFHRLATGNTASGVSLRGSDFFHIFPTVGIIGGDYVRNTGSGGRPVLPYFPGKRWFPDELPGKDLPFFRGALCSVGSMWSKKHGTNDSLFMISNAGTMKHNHSFVIFGEVLSGMDVIDTCTKLRLRGGIPLRRLWIKRCGEYTHTPEERERANTPGPVVVRSERY